MEINFLPFSAGLIMALAAGALLRILRGMRLHLYLTSRDTTIEDQSLIPITAEFKKGSLLHSLFKGAWREDVELTLLDHKGASYTFHIGYHLWQRFYLTLRSQAEGSSLDRKKIIRGKRYPLHNGTVLRVGDREFKALITSSRLERKTERESAEALSA